VNTAIGRELLVFIWAIGVQVDKEQNPKSEPNPGRRYQLKRKTA